MDGLPFFGICLGLQCGVIEFARNVLGLAEANSTEIEQASPDPVVCLLDEQYEVVDKGGTMRLGSYPCKLVPGSRAHQAYGSLLVQERHRHRYELNNRYRDRLSQAGFIISGTSPDGNLVEVIELKDHPWFRKRPRKRLIRRAVPRLEVLEDRTLLAVVPFPQFDAFTFAVGSNGSKGNDC